MTANGGVVGFSTNSGIAGSASASVKVKVVNANTNAVLSECNLALSPQICINYSGAGISSGVQVRYIFTFTTSNGTSGDGTIVFDNFSNGGTATSLPVRLESFVGSRDFSAVKLIWNTSRETNLSNYQIQKSDDGSSFRTLGSVPATKASVYTYADNKVSQENIFYRLKMIDIDGTFSFSSVIHVKAGSINGIQTYPNPVESSLQVHHTKAGNNTHLQIANPQGRILQNMQVPVNMTASSLNMSAFPAGVYYIILKTDRETLSKRIIKN